MSAKFVAGHVIAAGIILLAMVGQCVAQSWPGKPLRMVVPYASGGPSDSIARPLAQTAGQLLGQPVITDYKPGANSIVGAEFVARSAADGYTFLLATSSTLATNPAGYRTLPYDPMKDFAHVAKVGLGFHLIVARKGLPVNGIADLVTLAKKNPGKLNYGSTGVGSAGHMAVLLLESMAGIRMEHVPYKGGSAVLTDLLGDTVDFSSVGASVVITQAKAGRLKALASTAERRLAVYPEVPSMVELGYRGFVTGGWYSVAVPGGTPAPVVERLNKEVNAALNQPAVRKQMESEAYVVEGDLTPAQTTRFVADELQKWTRIIRDNNVVLD